MHSRHFIFAISLVMLASFKAYSGTATQTDWSGGDGVYGPVTDWGNEFYTYTDVSTVSPFHLLLLHLEYTIKSDFIGAVSVYSADVNGDNYMDVLGVAFYDDDITWWENMDGSGTIWTEHIVNGDFDGARSVHSSDVNGDGYMDVIGAAVEADDITWWDNVDGSGTSWIEHTIDGDFDGAASVHSADINGDGNMDVLGAACIADDITWWENVDGLGTSWIEHTVDGDFDATYSSISADVNGDGYMDVLGAAFTDADITWWENVDGSGTIWTEHTVDADFNGALSVYYADVNGDGYMDVLGAAFMVDDITWWENLDGTGTSWAEHTVSGDFDGARSVHSSDVNGDGYVDVLGAAWIADDITWWENSDTSPGIIWTEHSIDEDYYNSSWIFSEDINGDGYMDVIGASDGFDEITWWDLTKYLTEGNMESSVLDVQDSPFWQTIDWTCTEPAGTSVALQVRASDNSSSMGTWSDTLLIPCSLEGILTDLDCYLQYKVILNTTDTLSSPVLHDVTVTWNTVNTEGGSCVESYALIGARPNPALGYAVLVFSLQVDSWAELTLYDMTGRIVYSVDNRYIAGVHEVILDDLASGVYLVRMTSHEFTDTRRFVLIN